MLVAGVFKDESARAQDCSLAAGLKGERREGQGAGKVAGHECSRQGECGRGELGGRHSDWGRICKWKRLGGGLVKGGGREVRFDLVGWGRRGGGILTYPFI